MKADGVWTELLGDLHHIFQWRPVEHCNPATVSARRIFINATVTVRPAGADSDRKIGLLKDSQVHIGLGHSSQGQLSSTIPAVSDIISTNPHCLPPPRRTSSTPIHPIPTYYFRPPLPVACPACTGLSLSPFPVPFCPRWPALYIPVPINLSVFPSYSLLCAVHPGM